MSNNRPKKRSLTLNGHRTSVSLEDPFWDYFYKLAMKKNLSLNTLASEIDLKRQSDVGLATSIRIFCLTEATNH
jgi:predicted DNA-binding ribbon-helix-helix protein